MSKNQDIRGAVEAVRAAAHLAGYSALIGYIWDQRRASHRPAA